MKGILPFDYIEKPNEVIYNVRASWPKDSNLYVFPIFQKSPRGERERRNVRFKKNDGDKIEKIQLKNHYIIYRARKLYKSTFNKIPEEWKKIGYELEKIVGRNKLSVIGSWLFGFTGRDVDFAVYGFNSFKKISQNFYQLKKVTKTLYPSLEYQRELMKQYRHINPRYNTIEKFILRRFYFTPRGKKEGSTLRFVLEQSELPLNPYRLPTLKKIVTIEGIVEKGEGSHFYPRIFTLAIKEKRYSIISILHAHQSAVENGEYIRVRGELKKKNIVLIDNPNQHGIYIL
jgi:predicted nucleotidyltransferase